MSDVAREAGVSAMTVSNVLSGKPGASEQTRLRVLATVDRLGYEVDPAARQLRSGRSGVLGLLVPELDAPYFAHLAARLTAAAAEHGLRLVLEQTGSGREAEAAAVSRARQGTYDAVMVSPVELDPADLSPVGSTPVVFLGERPLPGEPDHIRMDNVGGAELATRHLIECGARRIALIGGAGAVHGDGGRSEDMASLRTRGYRRAHAAAGLEVDERLLVGDSSFSRREGRAAVLRLHEAGIVFDGAFMLTDAAAMGVLRGLADLGRSVPDDVQVVGFDNDPEGDYLVPRLTTVDPGNDTIARVVLDTVLRRLRAEPVAPSRPDGAAEARLVIRESTRHPASHPASSRH